MGRSYFGFGNCTDVITIHYYLMTMYEALEMLPLNAVLEMAAARAELTAGDEAITEATSITVLCPADGPTMAPLSA